MPDFKDVESLLFRGFLTAEVAVDSVPIVFKSLNHIEYTQIDLHSFSMDSGWEESASYFLAYSTLFLNHVSVLPNREEYIPVLADYYHHFPKSLLVSFLKITARLNQRSGKALRDVQRYACGPESRQMWQMYRGISLCDPKVTGFSGTENIGINMHQRMWSYFNTLDDEEIDYLKSYGLAKFVVSPHAPKDIKRIDARDAKKLEERDNRRSALYKGTDYVEEGVEQVLVTKDSAQELMSQMHKELRGEQDYHDLVIAEHKKKIRDAYLRRKEEMDRKRQEAYERRLKQEIAEEADFLSQEGYSAEEIAHYLEKSDRIRRVRRQERPENYQSLEEKERNLMRWGFLDPEDIPEDRRSYYSGKGYEKEEDDFENPLIKEHYKRVSDDLHGKRGYGPSSKSED